MKSVYDKALLQRVKRLRLGSKASTADVLGGYRSKMKGHGLEYIESRGYEAGDDVRRMDWKVTARTREPYVKVFQEEKQLRLLLLVDVSNSMRFGGARRTKLQTGLSCAMALAYAAVREHDIAQIVLFGDGIEKAFPAVSREREFWATSRHIETLIMSPYAERKTTAHFDQVVDYVSAQKAKPQLAFVFSDFRPEDSFTTKPARWPRRTGLIPVRIRSLVRDRKRLWFRGFDAERGGAVGKDRLASSETVLGRSPVDLNDQDDLWLSLRQVISRARTA